MTRSGSEVTVLVVDDEPQILTVWSLFFELLECEIDIAPNVEQAKRILSEKSVDIVITDLTMPGQSGIELLDFLQSTVKHDLRVYVSSGYRDQLDERVRGFDVERVIDKPFDFNAELRYFRALLNELRR